MDGGKGAEAPGFWAGLARRWSRALRAMALQKAVGAFRSSSIKQDKADYLLRSASARAPPGKGAYPPDSRSAVDPAWGDTSLKRSATEYTPFNANDKG
jgi:hypothetical protein